MSVDGRPHKSYKAYYESVRFTDWLRITAGDLWTQATEHRFTQDISNGTLPEWVFKKYLIQEYAFVEASATVTGYTIAKAPTMAQKAHLAKALIGLTTEQESFFQRAFRQMSIPEKEWEAPSLPHSVEAFKNFVVKTAAAGAYEEPLTTMLGAEWMYLTWCRTVSRHALEHPLIREWIDLHVTEAFEDGVVWMREQLDIVGPSLATERQEWLAQLFRRTLELEITFHHAPYDTVPTS